MARMTTKGKPVCGVRDGNTTDTPLSVAAASATNRTELHAKLPPRDAAATSAVNRWFMDALERQGIIRRLSIDKFGHVHISDPPGEPRPRLCIDPFGHVQIKDPADAPNVTTLAEILKETSL